MVNGERKAGMEMMNRIMRFSKTILITVMLSIMGIVLASSCKIYSFREKGTLPPDIKTVKVHVFESRARYTNTQFSTRLKDALELKVVRQTRLSRSNSEDAHYQIEGYISGYDVNPSGISGQTTATERLTVSIHLTLRNTLHGKTEEYDVSRSFEYPANLTLQEAEVRLLDEMIRNLSDEIFNRIFSNW
jgi:outer membrane lipopolysaccharide assembly protein LptE/RlpB